ncbi:MAG: endonuclease VIII, partial [Oscillospiraceae bacterium]|nr:endonuclease VIII [Oscillospiraceae bacterium]
MIEMPEAKSLASQLAAALEGREIVEVEAAKSPHGFASYTGDPATYPERLTGRRVSAARAHAGWVELELGDLSLVFFDGATPRLYGKDEKLTPKHQLRLGFGGGDSLVFTVQMYGGLFLFENGDSDSVYYGAARSKPSPYSEAFDRNYFEGLRAGLRPSLSAKAFIATEQRIPGLGNGCSQDILFFAGINPQSRLSALSEEEIWGLFDSVKNTLAAMLKHGGRDTEKDIFGKPGGYHVALSAKTAAYPCPKCGGEILRKAFLGGNVYF